MAQFSRCYRLMMLDMNKIPKLPFQKLILQETKEDIRNKRRIICKVIRLLHQLHDIGIIHNDVHPENIMKSNDRYYFIDFGKSVHTDVSDVSIHNDWFMLEYSFVHSFSYGKTIDYPVQIDLNYIRNDIKYLKDKITSTSLDKEIEELI
jgi:tRNA A-37 threonylcarbamoyl transferase component Bud32